ncbi:peroxidase family protein [Nocardioides sp. LHG3406-4]|uniref:peroxidase family protein n=1 Tax=Nocardioides sp. LHG3406-4 TaxID=2804575 RepID=UPI003CEA56C4
MRATAAGLMSLGLAGIVVTGSQGSATAEYEDSDFEVTRHDLEFILNQIKVAEHHAMGGELLCDDRADMSWTCVPDAKLPYGLRTVDGSFNNLLPNTAQFPKRGTFGAAGQEFPRMLAPEFKDAESFDPDGPAGPAPSMPSSYKSKSGYVVDSEPREISNLIVDQTMDNPAAAEVALEVEGSGVIDLPPLPTQPGTPRPGHGIFIPNVSPDEGLSASYNSWFTLFGQFFDHGLDLVAKGGSGTVMVPLKSSDPLYQATGSNPMRNMIPLTRATNKPGPDDILGTSDDIQEHTNRTTSYVDQNQTYTSHPSHQVFIREYEMQDGAPVPTGRLLGGAGGEGLANWSQIKAQASSLLGIELDDMDALAVPLVATDPYGHFIPGENGFPQVVQPSTATVEGDPGAPADATDAMKAGVAFLDDIAHAAAPNPEGTHDAALLGEHFITGDGRGNENIGLTSVHHVFHSEHNRLAAHIDELIAGEDDAFESRWRDESGVWGYGERLFQAARFVTEMEYQHLVFEEFARKVQPNVDPGPINESLYHGDIDSSVKAEFAHVVYRFGHSMLNETVDREGFGTTSMPLLDAFLNPAAFTDNGALTHDEGAAAVIQGMMNQTGNEIDEFVTDTLRNNLLGVPLDLATINLARGRDTGIPSLNKARRQFFANGANSALRPYASWEDFRLELKHRASIVNFIAAYGIHPTLASAGTLDEKRLAAQALTLDSAFMTAPAAASGLDDVDLWIGGLAERPAVFGGMLGTTFNHVFEEHMEDLQNGDRFYYLNRNQGLNLFHQLEANSFAELVMRNTAAQDLPVDMFASQDLTIDLDTVPAGGVPGLSQLDGWWRWDGDEHITMHGTLGVDRMRGGEGDDALWSHEGDDHLEGGIGNDGFHGGPGDDVLTDVFGDDTFHAGPGDDVVNAGHGFDVIFGQSGKDFLLHGQEATQSFAGQGADFLQGGNASDVMTGNEADDWLEGGKGADLVQGDNALTFQNDPVGGADVLDGGSGNDDHDAEGGDDIMLNNGRDRHAGMLGFDWVTHKGDPDPVDADLDVLIFQPPNVTVMRSRFMNVEGLSGWEGNDVLRGRRHPGDQAFPIGGKGHELTQAQLDRVSGLREMLSSGQQLEGGSLPEVPKYATPFLAINQTGNMLLGGGGSDLMEGRSGDDYLDGDAALDVYLELPGGERADSMSQVQERAFAGEIDPADIETRREIVQQVDNSIDTAVYADVRDQHTLTENGDGTWRVAHVDEDAGGLQSGVDTLRNIERVQFADETVDLVDLQGTAASGHLTFSTDQPKEDEPLTVTGHFSDPDGPIQTDTIVYTWQYGDDEGEFTPSANGVGATFTPGDPEAGFTLRVIATFLDANGTLESITSHTTLPVVNVNDEPTGLVVDPQSPAVGSVVAASGLVDPDGTHNDDGDLIVDLDHQWQRGSGSSWTNIPGATASSYTVMPADSGQRLRVRIRFSDVHGTPEEILSEPSDVVPDLAAPGIPALGAAAVAGASSARVTWSPPGFGESTLMGFEVKVLRNGATDRIIEAIAHDAVSLEVTGLEIGPEYRFQVRGVNAAGPGAWSPRSAPLVLSATPPPGQQPPAPRPPTTQPPTTGTPPVTGTPGTQPAAPAAPEMRSVRAGKAGGAKTIRVAWSAPELTGGASTLQYRVVVQKVRPGKDKVVARRSFGPQRLAHTFTLPKGRYRVTVVAVNEVGSSLGTTSKVVRAR